MCHCSDQLPVLYDRASAHSLDDTSCFFQKFRIRHLDHESFISLRCCHVDICHLDIIFFYLIVDITADLCSSDFDLLF